MVGKLRIAVALAGALIASLSVGTAAYAETIHVSAAISLKEALQAAAKSFEAKTGVHVDLAVGASGALATQIVNGAEADVFISAAQKQIDDLAARKLIDSNSRTVIARNVLTLIAPAGNGAAIKSFDDLKLQAVYRIAAGEPKVVPAGDYAKQVLDHLKLSDALKDKLIYGANVRQVLDYVTRGEVEAGLVYRTDALSAGALVAVVADADAAWASPIEYPAVIVSASSHPQSARAFMAYLVSADGQAELTRRGFVKPIDKHAAKGGGAP